MRIFAAFIFIGLASAPAAAQQKYRRDCTVLTVDSSFLATGPVLRDCDVDRVAKRKGSEPKLDLDELGASDGCFSAQLDFVVDTTGSIELGTVRTVPGSDSAMARAIYASLSKMRFDPATLNKQRVRQVVRYRRSAVVGAAAKVPFVVGRITEGGSRPPGIAVGSPMPGVPIPDARC